MQIWNYHPKTGELLGQGFADPNPVEEGEWILPAHSTRIVPPPARIGSATVFLGNAWSYAPDHRGETWWLADAEFNTQPGIVTALGDPTKFDPPLTSFEPPAPPVIVQPIVVSPDQIRRALTHTGLRGDVETYVAKADQDTKDIWQYAARFERDNVMVVAAAKAIGKTPEEVDALFELAISL